MLYKRPGTTFWQIKFCLCGRTIRRSAQTASRKLAEQIEQAAREEVLREAALGETQSITWADARQRWLDDKSTTRSVRTDRELFRSMDPFFEGVRVDAITAETIRKYATLVAKRASPATANRHLNLIRAIFKRLKKWELIAEVPAIEKYKLEDREPVWATRQQVDKLLAELPEHARAVVRFAVATGLRKANVTGLRWAWVDMERRVAVIPAAYAKAKKTIPLPLSDEAMDILKGQLGKNPEFVFTDHNLHAPVRGIKTAWSKARIRAGLPTFRFHDLRHTWASWHVQAGTPERILQELGGWASGVMVQRYAHLGLEHLAQFVNNSAK